MTFLRQLAFLLPIYLMPAATQAQNFYASSEYGLQIGGAGYIGDLNPHYGLKRPMPAGGVFYRYHLNPYISAKAMANYTRLGYDDQLSKNTYQQHRNLSFRSDILEIALLAEFNFFWFSTGDKHHRFTPYLTGGIGGFYYDPYVQSGKQRTYLRPLGTEGQNFSAYSDRKYQPVSICFPLGVGFKYWIKPGMNFSMEFVHRITLTDYLDDVSSTYVGIDLFQPNEGPSSPAARLQDPSIPVNGQKLGRAGKQRGDKSGTDQYFMLQCSFSFQLKTYKCPSHLEGVWSR